MDAVVVHTHTESAGMRHRTWGRIADTVAAFAAATLLAGCRSGGCVELVESAPLVLDTDSAFYGRVSPSSAGAVLPPGRYRYSDLKYKKDYLAYKITVDGRTGYVIHGAATEPCK